jgi:tetratricopeptide (TPR) repeat protein
MAKRRQKRESRPARPETTANPPASPFAPGSVAAEWRSWVPQSLLIIAAGLWIFWPSLHGGWLWDDDHYITDNRFMPDPQGFWKVWLHYGDLRDYTPLTAFVHWLQWQLWGNDTLGYHLTNVALHLTSAFLVWRLFARVGLPLAWLGAVFFTVHPIMIESVAWITELKNTLSLPPLLLAMLAWLAGLKEGGPRFYYGSLALFIVSLLAKPTGMMLPVLLLGHAFWLRGRIGGSDIKAALPFFAAALVAGLVTLFPPPIHSGSGEIPLPWQIGSAWATVGWSILFMLGKCLWPVGLLPVYPSLAVTSPSALDAVPWLALGALFVLLWLSRSGWARAILFGLGFFMINLVPVVGYTFKKYNDMIWSLDHLLYLPIIGLIALVVAALGYLEARLPSTGRTLGRVLVAAGALAMAWGGHAYAGWFDSWESLWTNELRGDPESRIALLHLGGFLADDHRYPEAIACFQKVLFLRPNDSDAHYDLGLVDYNLGRSQEEEEEYREAVRLNPGNAKAWMSLGQKLRKAGHLAEAEATFRQGLQASPDDPSLCIELGGLLLVEGKTADVVALYQHALESNPDLPQLQYNLGAALLKAGDLAGAVEHLQAAITLAPTLVAAHENFGVALAQQGQLPEAIDQFEATLRLDPANVIARNNLARALVQTGQIPPAMEQFEQVLQIDPNNVQARDGLARLKQYEEQHGPAGTP